MKNENGLSFIGVFFVIIFIIAFIVFAIVFGNRKINNVKSSDIKSNMLLIKGACKVINDEATINKNIDNYIGTILTEYKTETEQESETSDSNQEQNDNKEEKNEANDGKINDEIIKKFLSKNIISKDDYSNYYVLDNENLKKLNIDVENEKDSYYLINYKSGEVIITSGLNGVYKLSEIEKQ